MILRLRRAHLRMMVAATLVAAAGLAAAAIAAVGAHPENTRAPAAPPALATRPLPDGARLLCEVARVWTDPATTARVYAVLPDGPALLELQPLESRDANGNERESTVQPDTLVYWSPAGDALDHAYLLGAAPGRLLRRYPLPDAARAGGGRLLLWSLGHHELIAAGTLPTASTTPTPSTVPATPATPDSSGAPR